MPRDDIAKDGVATRFSKENQPEKNGRHKGVPNRATLLRKWLAVKRDLSPEQTRNGKAKKGTVEDEVILALIEKALSGDVAAIKEVQDSLHGKVPNKHEVGGEDGEPIKMVVFKAIDGSNSDDNPDE